MSYYKEVQTKRLFALEIYSFTRHYFLLRSIVLRHHVVLPDLRLLMRTARQMELPCMETPTPPAPLTIIVVEDNPEDLYIMNWVLKAHNFAYNLQVIDNGNHALHYVNQLAHAARRRSPTIMLLDLNLPQVDGKEVLRQIKTMPHVSDIPVVIVTSSTNPADQQETLALGADAYFVKPYHLHEFLWLGEVIKHLVFGDPPSFTQHI